MWYFSILNSDYALSNFHGIPVVKKILLVDDHLLLAEALQASLSNALPDYDFISCDSLSKANQLLREKPTISLAIFDFYMPGSEGISTFESIVDDHKSVSIALMSGRATKKEILDCLNIGITGFIVKSISVKDMAAAVQKMVEGGMYLPTKLFDQPVSGTTMLNSGVSLTNRERDTLILIIDGLTNKQIARQLGVTEVTVKMYASRLLTKYNAKNRVDLTNKSRDDLLFTT